MKKYIRKGYICFWCGGKAKYRFKNGRLCCNDHQNKCPAIKNKISIKQKMLGENHYMKNPKNAKLHGEKIKGKKWSNDRRANHPMKNPKNAKAHSERMRGRKHTEKSKEKMSKIQKGHYVSEETKRKIGDKHRGKIISKETRIKLSKTLKGRIFTQEHCNKISKSLEGIIRSKETIEKMSASLKGRIFTQEHLNKISKALKGRPRPDISKRMKNGGAAYCNSFIQNPSKPQVKLFELIKLIYPNAILNHPSLNFCIDIAIPDKWIAIEYDEPYWHDKNKDGIRQNKLESIGWKFLRYESKIPSMKELKKDFITL